MGLIEELVANSTVMVYDEANNPGTGFLLAVGEGPDERLLLVTARHVLGIGVLAHATHCTIAVRRIHNGHVTVVDVQVPLAATAHHPNLDFDIACLEVTQQVQAGGAHAHRFVRQAEVPDQARLDELDIRLGEAVVVPCYPATAVGGNAYGAFAQGRNRWPLIRSGTVASPVDDELRYPRNNQPDLVVRGFTIDCAVSPGVSGAPVFLNPMVQRLVNDQFVAAHDLRVVLGIVISTEFVPLDTGSPDVPRIKTHAGLGIVSSSMAIRETIQQIIDI